MPPPISMSPKTSQPPFLKPADAERCHTSNPLDVLPNKPRPLLWNIVIFKALQSQTEEKDRREKALVSRPQPSYKLGV
jgi:hypothetical protein